MTSGPSAATLSLPVLVELWRATELFLRGAGRILDDTSRASVAQQREWLLDEFERRDPTGFGYWLHAGGTLLAVPERDPSAFLSDLTVDHAARAGRQAARGGAV